MLNKKSISKERFVDATVIKNYDGVDSHNFKRGILEMLQPMENSLE